MSDDGALSDLLGDEHLQLVGTLIQHRREEIISLVLLILNDVIHLVLDTRDTLEVSFGSFHGAFPVFIRKRC